MGTVLLYVVLIVLALFCILRLTAYKRLLDRIQNVYIKQYFVRVSFSFDSGKPNSKTGMPKYWDYAEVNKIIASYNTTLQEFVRDMVCTRKIDDVAKKAEIPPEEYIRRKLPLRITASTKELTSSPDKTFLWNNDTTFIPIVCLTPEKPLESYWFGVVTVSTDRMFIDAVRREFIKNNRKENK